ncbi:glycosyl hydrolase family 76-domain-containing protein [Zopfochytrium polystomum]|nr:glycosyl hydrolase family 76-domain-containing protein [Zopfochytrium polystomum]
MPSIDMLSLTATATAAVVAAVAGVSAVPSIDFTDSAATLSASKSISKWMTYYFSFYSWADQLGAWDQSIVQWHESGIYYNSILDYMDYSGDYALSGFVNKAMYMASGDGGDFLFGCDGNCGGKWNDDIGWWGLAALTGSELYGTASTARIADSDGTGQSWIYVANFTLFRILEDVDSQCGGGAYWSRDRSSTSVNLRTEKSTITNTQVIWFALRLYSVYKDQKYLDIAKTFWDWVLTAVTDRNTYMIYDGVYADGTCTVDGNSWSYYYVPMAMAGATLNQITGNSSYLTDGLGYYKYWKTNFINGNGAFYEPLCGTKFACKDPTGFNFPVYETLADLYNTLPDSESATKTEVKSIMATQGKNLLSTLSCSDAWNCVRTLNPVPTQYTYPNGTNPRDQIEMMSYINGMVRINGVATPTTTPSVAAVVSTTPKSAACPETAFISRTTGMLISAVTAGLFALSGWAVISL